MRLSAAAAASDRSVDCVNVSVLVGVQIDFLCCCLEELKKLKDQRAEDQSPCEGNTSVTMLGFFEETKK